MNDQSGRMKSLVNDLLHLSKLESDSGVANDWFPLFPMCAAVVDQLKAYAPAGEEDCRAEIELDCEQGLSILGCEDEFNSVLSNLLTNAIKYGRLPGKRAKIALKTSLVSNGLEIRIIDQGPGIPDHHIARLTERFYRVDDSRESSLGGSGLGLAIVKYALEHHDAELRVESSLRGSQFSFVIPAERIQ